MAWKSLFWTTLRVVYRAVDGGRLPERQGSMFRGAVLSALRELACLHQPICYNGFDFPSDCPFGALHEATDGGRGSRPQAYVIDSESESQVEFGPGEELAFGFTLFGYARTWLPWVTRALAGEKGFGVHRSRWRLESAATFDEDGRPRQHGRATSANSTPGADLGRRAACRPAVPRIGDRSLPFAR